MDKEIFKCRKPISRMTVDELYAVKIQMRDIITAIKGKEVYNEGI